MAEINRETIEHIANLAKLYLTEEEKEHSETDMRRMTAYIDKLNEISVSDIKADAYINNVQNGENYRLATRNRVEAFL